MRLAIKITVCTHTSINICTHACIYLGFYAINKNKYSSSLSKF